MVKQARVDIVNPLDDDIGSGADGEERFARIQSAPAYQRVADAIEREIVTGRIRPGEPIGTEAELVKQFGVNRSTVREGIRLLEQSGLVHRDSSRRLSASLPHYNRLAPRISRALILHQVTFRELWEATLALGLATIEQAAVHATSEIVDAMEENIARTKKAASDPAAVAELDTEFHAMLGKASANRVLQLAREPSELLICPTTEPILRQVKEATPRLIAAHGFIVDALRRHDVDAARLWMRRHLNDWRKGFLKTGKDLDQPVDRIGVRHLLPDA
jgi:GntR family transcriptional regulator, transcriptional repressor for pyruvate dehydrogenase complex